jgi:Zn-dependent peptidase ImmA (M78 family)/DNA-binding XRE family transcriptional regulator
MPDFATLLKSARIMRGYSLQDLANQLKNRVTKQALGKYEKNLMKPNPETFALLCDVLGVGPEYFYRDREPVADNLALRKVEKLGAKERERLRQHIADAAQRYMELETVMGATASFKNPIKSDLIKTASEVEEAAHKLREKWLLGPGPIKDVIDLLESRGVKVIELEGDGTLQSTSGWISNKCPVMAFATTHTGTPEKRLTALRELGHLMLNFHEKLSDKQRERLCDRFASALLMPAGYFGECIGEKREHIPAVELSVLGAVFGVPVRSIVGRATDLGIVSEHFSRSNNPRLLPEPLETKKQKHIIATGETAKRFRLLLYRAVAEEIISTSRAAELADIRLADLRDELARGYT